MHIRIPVDNRREGELLRAGLVQPEVRAFVKVCAVLEPLSEGGRRRVLTFFEDQLREACEVERVIARSGAVAANDGAAS